MSRSRRCSLSSRSRASTVAGAADAAETMPKINADTAPAFIHRARNIFMAHLFWNTENITLASQYQKKEIKRGREPHAGSAPLCNSCTRRSVFRYETLPLLMVETPRRFCAQHASFDSTHTGRSLPYEIVSRRAADTPKLAR